jgi:hypothetical protein
MSAGKLMALVITETMKLIGDRRRSRVGAVHAADLALRHLEINRAYGNLIHHDW